MTITEQIAELEKQLASIKEAVNNAAQAKEQDKRPVTERITTFGEALDALGEDHPLVIQFNNLDCDIVTDEPCRDTADLIAYYKLRIITAALNEGWEPHFTDDEYRYYPWFYLYTKKEWDELTDEEKEGGLLFGGRAYYGVYAGFACAASNDVPSDATASAGSRLCFRTETLARYAGRQFVDLYADFFLIRK